MNQFKRDKQAVRCVLEQTGGTYFDEISLRAGEGLWPALGDMLEKGEVTVKEEDVPKVGRRKIFRLAGPAKDLKLEGVSPVVEEYVRNSNIGPLNMEPVPLPGKASLDKVDEIMRKASKDD